MTPHAPRSLSRLGAVALLCVAPVAAALTSVPATAAPLAPPTAPRAEQVVRAQAPLDGRWRVTEAGDGRYEVSWTASRRLPVTSDRPTIVPANPKAVVVEPAVVGDDGRTVSATVTSTEPLAAADLDVVLSGDRLDEPGHDLTGDTNAPAARAATSNAVPLDGDPAQPGPFTTTSSDYALDSVKLPGFAKNIEMVGHVVEPAADQATGPRPLVLFLHGRHDVCYNPASPNDFDSAWPCRAPQTDIPSHLGYAYLQELLASQGYATVSIRANGISAQDDEVEDGGANARAMLVQRHLDYWAELASEHQLDLSNVTLVGHSRGGEGVNLASVQIPLSAPYRINGEVLLAPTDFSGQTAPYVPIVAVLPECDGDVVDLQGQTFVDAGRDVMSDDTSLKSSVFVAGANHNFFNTEWTPGASQAPSVDDWGLPGGPCGTDHAGRLNAPEQRDAAEVIVAGAVQLFNGADQYLPLFDGTAVDVPSLGKAQVFSHAILGGRTMRRPGEGATPTAATGGMSVDLCRGVQLESARDTTACGAGLSETQPHWRTDTQGMPSRRFARLSWTTAGGVGGLTWTTPLDLRSNRLELRTIVDGRRSPAEVAVRLTDATGAHVDVEPDAGPVLTPPRALGEESRLWARSVVVSTASITGVDLSQITAVELVAKSATGRLWIADLSAAPSALPPLLAKRAPQINVGRAVVVEGDGPGRGTAQVPFTIVGEVTEPAEVVAFGGGEFGHTPRRTLVKIEPGQTHGSVAITYPRDRLDSSNISGDLVMWQVRGLVTDDYVGELVVRDDDPDATFSATVSERVREGEPIVIRVKASAPSAMIFSTEVVTARAPGAQLRQNDLPRHWLRAHVDKLAPTRPLAKTTLFLGAVVKPGQSSAVVKIPTLRDGRREKTEKVRLKIRTSGGVRTFTVRVVNR